jgi:hypothetical protein
MPYLPTFIEKNLAPGAIFEIRPTALQPTNPVQYVMYQ